MGELYAMCTDFLMAGPLCRGERNAQYSSRHMLVKGHGGRGNRVAAWAREPMSGRQEDNNRST